MKLRYVFSEMPYAFSLSSPYNKTRCSFCAGPASKKNENRRECDRGCRFAVYCSQRCLENDRPFHGNECLALRQGKWPGDNDTANLGVRLMGRMISRYRLDKGVAVLSSGFPSHMLKDRRFDDLMTHERELRRSSCHEESFREIKTAFRKFFSDTELASTDGSILRKFFHRLAINGFSLNVYLKAHPDSCEELGEVVYLNVSRFNHSCRPTCLYRFDGARIIIEYIEYDDAGADKPLRLTKDQFENLTLQYGYGSYWNYGTSCPLTEQRIRSLKSRYFFTCQCVLCADKSRNEIQLDSAPVECTTCKSPFVWRRTALVGSMKLKKSCKCRSEKGSKSDEAKMISVLFGKETSQGVKRLVPQWGKVMRLSLESKRPRQVVDSCAPVIELADKYWHPTCNLRLAQLNEKAFCAMQELKVKDEEKFVGDRNDLDFMLKMGETLLNVYSIYFEPYMLPVASYAAEVAGLYKLRAQSSQDAERCAHWYNFAINVWEQRGEKDCARVVEEQSKAPPLVWCPKSG